MMEEIAVKSGSRSEFIDITHKIGEVVGRSGTREGVCHVSSTHTTAAVTINENADPTVPTDILGHLDRMVPWRGPYQHSEGNSAAHIKSSLVGESVMLPVKDGRLVLGTWQGIFFCEFDGPRQRRVIVTVLPGA
ncbi:secondary thiamine-phosphate synthase enzyme YjbQ [candidate division KSB1 bacterium]